MTDDIQKILDRCLARLSRGETVEQCLADYPRYRAKLEPRLRMALTVLSVPRVSPSEEFRQKSQARLMTRLRNEARDASREHRRIPGLSWLGHRFIARPLVPAIVIVLAALGFWLVSPLFSPEPVYAQEYTLSLLKGSAEVMPAGATAWEQGTDGVKLAAGTQVRTDAGSYALLTFFDGSTMKLEPDTEVTVRELEYLEQRSVRIAVEQKSGGTWNHVLAAGGESPYFAVEMPQVRVVARGTSFGTQVDESGRTRLSVTEGAIDVIGLDKELRLVAEQRIDIRQGATPSAIVPARAFQNELTVSTGIPGVSSVRDPNGASTGYLPSGLAFNQITGSKAALSPDRQQITVEEPAPGEYAVVVRAVSGEAVPLSIQVRRGGSVVFEHAETLKGVAGQGWVIHINLDAAEDSSLGGKVVSVVPLAGKAPETVVETEYARQRAVPIRPADPSSQGTIRMPELTPSPDGTTEAPTRPSLKPAPIRQTPEDNMTSDSGTTRPPDPAPAPDTGTTTEPAGPSPDDSTAEDGASNPDDQTLTPDTEPVPETRKPEPITDSEPSSGTERDDGGNITP